MLVLTIERKVALVAGFALLGQSVLLCTGKIALSNQSMRRHCFSCLMLPLAGAFTGEQARARPTCRQSLQDPISAHTPVIVYAVYGLRKVLHLLHKCTGPSCAGTSLQQATVLRRAFTSRAESGEKGRRREGGLSAVSVAGRFCAHHRAPLAACSGPSSVQQAMLYCADPKPRPSRHMLWPASLAVA